MPTLLAADPSLLLQPDRLKVNLRGLAAALGVSGSEVAAMGGREPTVLALQGAQVAARLAELQSSFRVSVRFFPSYASVLVSGDMSPWFNAMGAGHLVQLWQQLPPGCLLRSWRVRLLG